MADISLTAANIRALTENGAVTEMGAAGGSMTVGDVVYRAADGDWEQADGNASNAAARARGVVVIGKDDSTSIVAGDPITVCLFGPVEGFSGMTVNDALFVSDTAGKLADAAGTVSHLMGHAASASRVWLQPSQAASTS